MFIHTSTLVAILGLVSAAPVLAAPTGSGSSLPSIRRSLASKLERRALKLAERQNDPQQSLTLNPKVISKGLAQTGQEGGGDPGQVASLTSTNNFINHCLTQNVPLTDGLQIKTGSCNVVPMGRILATDKMPISKFTNPANGATIAANQAFTVTMAIQNLKTGNFVNPNKNYYSAPAQVDNTGTLIGHSHVTIQLLPSLGSTVPLDANKFAFFKGFNLAANNGVLSADVTGGLPAGAYRMCSINTAANHQAALVAVAQRGSLDDCVYFTCGNAGGNNGNAGGNNGNAGGNNGNAGGNNGNAGANTGNGNNTGNIGGGKAATTAAPTSVASSTPVASSTAAAGNGNGGGRGGNGNGRGGNGGGRGGNAAASTSASAAVPVSVTSSAAPAASSTAAGNGGGRGGFGNNNGGGRGGFGNGGGRGNGNNAAAAAATPSSSSSAPVASPTTGTGAGAATGGNVQKFTGSLGGTAPPVTAGGSKGFVINGSEFINKGGALQRSCDIQKNNCSNAANGSGNKAPLTVSACEQQATACSAAISS